MLLKTAIKGITLQTAMEFKIVLMFLSLFAGFK